MKSLVSTLRAWFTFPLVTALLLSSLVTAQTTSSVPGFISFQSRVTAPGGATIGGGGSPVNRIVIFRIWGSPTSALASDLIYSEQQTVTIAESEFSALIGQGTNVTTNPLGYDESPKGPQVGGALPGVVLSGLPVFAGAARYLGVTVNDPSSAATAEISPRQQIVTAAYAFRAKYAESLGSNGTSALSVVDGGNVGVGFSNPGFKLEVNGNVSAAGSIAATGASGFTFRSGDTDGGLFSPADDTVVIKTNNANRVTVTSAGVTVNTGTLFAAGHSFTAPGDTDGGIFSPADGTMTFLTNAAERMRLDSSGRLGLGTTTAAFPFEVRNSAPEILVGTTAGTLGALYFGTSGFGVKRNYNGVAADVGLYGTGGDLYLSSSGATKTDYFVLKNNGNVAIGAASPTEKLNVGGNIRVQAGSAPALFLTDGAVTGTLGLATSSGQYSTDATYSDTVLRANTGRLMLLSGAGAAAIAIATDNRVSIGTISPANVKLTVSGGSSVNGIVGAYLNSSVYGTSVTHGAHTMSIYASGGIWTGDFFVASSDARMKAIVGRSDAARDLATLQGIEVTDYTYVDTVAKGTGPQKKVIAQQVEKVFPQAVKRQTDSVPDIYQKATIKGGWVTLETNLQPGERVKLLAEKKEGIHEVLEVAAGKFRTDFATDGDEVFVYGREVKDFRVVDYEAIAMLNVSATQQLKRETDAEVKSLRAENAALRAQLAAQDRSLAELARTNTTRDAKLAAIEKVLSTATTVMARPAKAPAASEE
jgi:hypothetical protein